VSTKKEHFPHRELKEVVARFPWGTILHKHLFGPYLILKYRDKHDGNEQFQPYVYSKDFGWQDTHASFNGFDEATAHAIAYRREGPNTQADQYFIRGMRKEGF
jgi:hypothetical protein